MHVSKILNIPIFWKSLKYKLLKKDLKNYQLILNPTFSVWQELFLKVSKPNLLQSWNYGLAKTKSENWSVCRGIILQNEKPVAIYQALERSCFFMKIVRLNLGPLWLIEPTEKDIKEVFYLIKSNYSLRKLSILSIAPNLSFSAANKKILNEIGIYKNKINFFQLKSGLVDLKKSEENLLKGLRSNWRRQLRSAEKHGLKLIKTNSPADFNWLMSMYDIFRREKNFTGVSINLLHEFFKLFSDSNEIWIFIALDGEERIGGLLILNYITGCIPIIICLSQKGRARNAGNFLLWNALLYAKNQGCSWFDQGGMDNSDAPISKFKSGLPCVLYDMIGEYVSF